MRLSLRSSQLSLVGAALVGMVALGGCGATDSSPQTSNAGGSATGSGKVSWPTKDIQLIVPYSAGGGTDILSRAFAAALQKKVGKTVVVVNKPGASGEVGMTAIAQGKPDGYHLGFVSFPDNVIQTSYEKTTYQDSQFDYIATFTQSPNVLIVKPNSPYKTLADFVKYAKAHPGQVTVSTSGDAHILNVVEFEKAADIQLTPVKFSGGGKNLNAVIGGQVDAAILAEQFAKSAMDQGCKVLAVAGDKRLDSLPDVPTFKESGYDAVVMESRVLTTPKGTPQDVVNEIQKAVEQLSNDADFQKKIEGTGEIYRFLDGDALNQYLTAQSNAIEKVVTANKAAFTN